VIRCWLTPASSWTVVSCCCTEELGAEIASHLDEIRLLGGECLLQQPDGGQDGVPFRRPRRIALGEISP